MNDQNWTERNPSMMSTSCRTLPLRGCENGVVIELFALMLGLLALLAFGYSLQLPTNQASALRAHHALQVGSAAGVVALDDKDDASLKAYQTAASVIANDYASEGGGFPTGRFSEDLTNFTVMIPNRNYSSNTAAGYFIYRCSGSSCTYGSGGADISKQLQIAGRMFDMTYSPDYNTTDAWGTFDYKNAVLLYAEAEPLSHSIYKTGRRQPIVSVARLAPVLTYVLVDTAMSASPNNFDWMFGATESNSETPTDSDQQWPVVFNRPATSTDPQPQYYTGGGWTYPTGVGAAQWGPRGESDQTSQEVRNFFASYCFNSPWDLYKGAVVDLIDWLSTSSAFDYSTSVGLVAPIRSARDQDPNYTTASTESGTPTNFSPLAHFGPPNRAPFGVGSSSPNGISIPYLYPSGFTTSDNIAHVGFVETYPGWIKQFDPYDMTGANRFWNKANNGVATDPNGGINMWSNMLCRAFVSQDDSYYTLTEDRTTKFDVGTRPEPVADGNDRFDYREASSRQRTAGAGKPPHKRMWTSGSYYPSFSAIDLNDTPNGYHGARNFIAGLGPTFLGIQKVIQDVAGHTDGDGNWTTWSRSNAYENGPANAAPGDPCMNTYNGVINSSYVTTANCNNRKNDSPGAGDPLSAEAPTSDVDTSSRMATDWRDIPSAMRAACEALAIGKTGYMSNPFLATERPIGSSKLVVFGFGLFSPKTASDLGLDANARKAALRNALNYCSCTKNIEVIMNFLPLSEWDRGTVVEAAEVITEYQRKFNASCKPMYFPDVTIAGCSATKSVQFFVSEPDSYTNPDHLVAAAIKFREMTQNLKPLFIKFIYNM